MTTFRDRCRDTCVIGDVGEWWTELYLRLYANTERWIKTDKGTLHREIQERFGDFVISNPDGSMAFLESKAEQDYAGKRRNIVMETYSNYDPSWPAGDPRIVEGWFSKSRCDYLFYAFVGPGDLYIIDFPRLREWSRERFHILRPFVQGKNRQRNRTCGYLAPVEDVLREVPSKHCRYIGGGFEFVYQHPGFVAPWESR